jgi:hypothetical protein
MYEHDNIEGRGDPERYVRDPQTGRHYSDLIMQQGWEPKAANVPPITAFIEAEAQADTPTLSRITDRMAQLSRTPQSPVEISTLRAEFPELSKEEFDSAMLGLAEEGRIALRRHDYASPLSEEERDRLVKIGDDYFIAATFPERLKIDGISLEARKHAEDLVSRWTDFANDRTDFQTLVENSRVEYARDPQNPRAGIIYMNSHAYRLYELMLSEELERDVSFPAITTPGDNLIEHRIMLAKFERVASPEGAKAISAINDAIRQAQQDGVDGVIFFNVHLPGRYWDLAFAHEGFHVWQYGAPETGAGWVERQPGYDRIRDELLALGYADDPQSIAREWAAHAVTDDLERFGFTRDEGAHFLHAYFSEIINQGGIDALDRVGNVSPRAQSIIETKRWRYARNQSRSQQQARTEAGGPGASPGSETSEITTGRGPTGASISLQGRPGNGRERGGRAPDATEVRRGQPAGLTEALKPVRFEAGKRLTPDEKSEVLRSLGDSYKDLRAPKIEKGLDARGETIFGYAYNPDYMLVSDITGRHIRHYVKLPDGRIAHPTELFPNLTKTEIDQYAAEREHAEKQRASRDRSRQNRIASPEETPSGVALKSHANAKYKATNRTLEGSYFAQDDQGRIARVDGKDAEDVAYYEAQGFKPVNPASGSYLGSSLAERRFSYENTIQPLHGRGNTTEALIAALQTIANIEAPDPSGKRSLKELSGAARDVARSAIAQAGGAEAIQDKEVGAALGKIAGVGTTDQQGRLLSWQDRIDTAVKIARETVEEIQSRTLARGAAVSAAEMAQSRQPSPRGHGIGW